MTLQSIGTVRSSRKDPFDDGWDQESASVELAEDFGAETLMGLDKFSHVEVIFYMNQVDPAKIETRARHPRNNPVWPQVGIFAQRAKNRPNQIGTTICQIIKVEGSQVYLRGLDAIDGTPVLDIKPWVKEFGPAGEVYQPSWITELMMTYWIIPGSEGRDELTKQRDPQSIFDPVILNTDGVRIRPLSSVTWEQLAEGLLYQDSFHSRSWGISTGEDVRRMYFNSIYSWRCHKGNPIVFLDPSESRVLGMTNFMNVEPTNKMVEIGGTWIGRSYQRTHVNTETKFALLQYCFEKLKLNRVEFKIDADNLVSQKAIERLGVNHEGLLARRKINAKQKIRDYKIYAVTDLTWPNVKQKIQTLSSSF